MEDKLSGDFEQELLNELKKQGADTSNKRPNIHKGHRARVRRNMENDPELNSFSDIQILEALLFCAIPQKDTNPIAHALIEEFGSLYGVLCAESESLKKVPNMTANAANLLPMVIPAARQAELWRSRFDVSWESLASVVDYLSAFYANRTSEVVHCAFLDINYRLISFNDISRGDYKSSPIDVKRIVQLAIKYGAQYVIISHNHPSGIFTPSNEDIVSTQKLMLALSGIDIILVDHLIFSSKVAFSLRDNGLMQLNGEVNKIELGDAAEYAAMTEVFKQIKKINDLDS